jgi:hypothetical protein
MTTLAYVPPTGCRDRLLAMSPAERFAAFKAGELSLAEMNCWASRHPEEVPLVNGEYPWIVATLADLD